jgi:hypothetical protein
MAPVNYRDGLILLETIGVEYNKLPYRSSERDPIRIGKLVKLRKGKWITGKTATFKIEKVNCLEIFFLKNGTPPQGFRRKAGKNIPPKKKSTTTKHTREKRGNMRGES